VVKMPRINTIGIFLFWKNRQTDVEISVSEVKKGCSPHAQWIWRVWKNNQTLKEFKTKKEALKFAINWMREHPNPATNINLSNAPQFCSKMENKW